jgi:short-subunit dehydrogenase
MTRAIGTAVVVITGASTGIGRATALQFARQGATVVVSGRRAHVLQRLAEHCDRLGGRALAVPADVTDQEALQSLAQRARDAFGSIDVWVNNAAVTLFARLEEAPYEVYRHVIETNLFGCIHGARAVLPYFRQQGRGTLINVASVVGKIGSPLVSAYTTSKFGIIGLSESLRMELQDAPDIHVCTVLPASIDTPLFQHAANFTGKAVKPLEPIYSAEQVARAIVDLARRPRREIVVGTAGKIGALLHTLAPGVTARLFAQQVEKHHLQDKPAPESPGNVFQPMEAYESVSGGWRMASSRGKYVGRAIAGVAALGLGLGILLAYSARRQPGLLGR